MKLKLDLEHLVLDNPIILVYQLAHLVGEGNEAYNKLNRVFRNIYKNNERYRADYVDWHVDGGRWSKDDT